MTGWRFVWRSLGYFRGAYPPVLACCALAAMVLLGALVAGDSVRTSLRRMAEERTGRVEVVLDGGGRWVRAALADDLAADGITAAPVMVARAEVAAGGRVLGGVQVLGVDERFFRMGPDPDGDPHGAPREREFHINDILAQHLGLAPGAELVLRFAKPGAVPADTPLAGPAGEPVVARGTVAAVRDRRAFGRFGLEHSQLPRPTVMVPLVRLQDALQQPAMANLLLLQPPPDLTPARLEATVRGHCQAEDLGLAIDEIPLAGEVEVRPTRVLFDPPLAAAVRRALPAAQPVITYLANSLTVRDRTTPYSLVTAVDPQAAPFLPADFSGVAINSWLAEDLDARAGDDLTLTYYAVDANERLVERSATFPITVVLPLEGLAADRRWMPEFPGVAAAENAADWDAGVPIDASRIREKDEAYWDEYRGTPKAFLPLAAGRELFGSRWGEFTALRAPLPPGGLAEARQAVLEAPRLGEAGLVLRDLRREALAAADSPVDFAGLLLGMSFILIAAAVGMGAMAFRFHIERREREGGLLAALGVPARRVFRWRLAEGAAVALIGGLLGVAPALLYVQWLLRALAPVWDGGSGGGGLAMTVEIPTLAGGLAAFVAVMAGAIWLAVRRQARRGASLRLAVAGEETPDLRQAGRPWVMALALVAGAAALAGHRFIGLQAAFFLGGALLLAAGLAMFRRVLLRRRAAAAGTDLARLAALNCARRPARSLVAAGTLAAGVFIVVSVAAFRKDAGPDHPGTGGFALWAETTLPGARSNTQTPPGDPLDLGPARPQFGAIQAFRAGPGDDASCQNLNRVARPRLLATDTRALAERGAFPIRQVLPGAEKSWHTLRDGEVMRAFVDEATLLWALKRKIGDRIIYQDDWGRDYPVEIAGTLADSVFQGHLLVDTDRYLVHHPQAAPPQVFLIEAAGDANAAAEGLRRLLADRGVRADTTMARLAAFHEVEHTYLGMFQALGGLGVMLGAAGLGLLTARNLHERRREFAILRAVGLPMRTLRRLVLGESTRLAAWGLAIGLVAALLAILPGLGAAGAFGVLARLIGLGAAIAACGWLGSWAACRRYLGTATASPAGEAAEME